MIKVKEKVDHFKFHIRELEFFLIQLRKQSIYLQIFVLASFKPVSKLKIGLKIKQLMNSQTYVSFRKICVKILPPNGVKFLN